MVNAILSLVALQLLLLNISSLPLTNAFTLPASVGTLSRIKTTSSAAFAAEINNDDDETNNRKNNRRDLLFTTTLGAVGSLLLGTASLTSSPHPAHAAANNEVLTTLLARLRQVPTFCIVNTEGSPYMMINRQEAIAKGYAFTSMEGAVTVLSDAQKSAQDGGYADIWKDATIVTLPADVAVRLTLAKKDRIPSRGGAASLPSILQIIATTQNRDDAVIVDRKGFQDQGKTPLFYMDSDELASPNGDGTRPLFMQAQALVDEWNKQHPGQAKPPVKVVDMTYLVEATVRGYTDRIPNQGNVSFVADPEQVEIAKKMRKEKLTMYNFDKMVV